MKFSIQWLGDFIKVKDFLSHPEKLSESLTRAGLEIESVQDFSKQFKNVVVAEIKEVEKHPNADKLTLCKVSTGKKTYSIVCGAKNHKVGDKVVLALEGSVLPENFVIKKSRIRGEESEGMLVSSSELGLPSQSEDGILILPKEVELGLDFATYYGLDQVVLDINVTPNRSDCLSHVGLSREISCLFDRSFSKSVKKINCDKNLSVKKKLKVEVIERNSCPRYSGRYIEGVTIGESPEWLKQRLKSVELKSINNIVDITNYILWDRGQPLHAFDADKIDSISVKKSIKGEEFVSLDDNTLTLTGEELTIRDKDQVLALAGVIGGKDSSISSETKNIFLESAYFRPEGIRRTSRRFGLQTDSSYRFSRGIDPETVKESLDFACALIQELAGGKVSEDLYDFYPKPLEPKNISITLEDLESRLGYKVNLSRFLKWMKLLKCEIKDSKKESLTVKVPSFRSDLAIKEDLIEEFARLEGYDLIPEVLPKSFLPKPWDSQFVKIQELQKMIRHQGCSQVINYSFSDPDLYREFLKDKEDLKSIGLKPRDFFPIKNPISYRLSIMKNFLTPDIFKNVHYNFRHGNKWGQVFEISPVFYKEADQYKQDYHFVLAKWGQFVDLWTDKKPKNVFYLKSIVENILIRLSYKSFEWEQISPSVFFLHPEQTLLLKVQNKTIGYIGTLHPYLQSKYKMPIDVALAEFDWSELWRCSKKSLKVKNLSPFSTLEKDLTFVIPSHIAIFDIQKEIQKVLGSVCENVEIFDLYEKDNKRSVSFRLYLTPEKEAWTDQNLQEFQNKVIDHIAKKFSVDLK